MAELQAQTSDFSGNQNACTNKRQPVLVGDALRYPLYDDDVAITYKVMPTTDDQPTPRIECDYSTRSAYVAFRAAERQQRRSTLVLRHSRRWKHVPHVNLAVYRT